MLGCNILPKRSKFDVIIWFGKKHAYLLYLDVAATHPRTHTYATQNCIIASHRRLSWNISNLMLLIILTSCVWVCVHVSICVSFWPRQQHRSHLTSFPQIPPVFFSKTWKNLVRQPPPVPPSYFLRIPHMLWVAALYDHIWPFLLPWVGGCVASKKSVVEYRNFFLFTWSLWV